MIFDEFSWAVGLFEGEGCISKNRRSLSLTLRTTDEDVLVRFHRIVCIGNMHGPHQNGDHKPYWQWQAFGAPAHGLLNEMIPHLGERRASRAAEVLETTTYRAQSIAA